VTRDISQPLESQGGVVVEVNAGPGLLMHVFPAQGKPRPVGEAIVNSMFRDGAQGRIPLIGLLKTPSSEMIDQAVWQVLLAAGPGAGRSGLEGAGIDGRQLLARVPTEKAAADALLANDTVHRALLSVTAGDVLNHGLAVDQLRVAVLGRLAGADRDTRETARVLVENVAGSGSVVVPAADPVARALVRCCAQRVIFVDANPRLPSLQAHRDQGHVVLFITGGNIHLARGEYEVVLAPLRHLVQRGHFPRSSPQVEAALAAAAVAWAIHLPGKAMRTGLTEFLR